MSPLDYLPWSNGAKMGIKISMADKKGFREKCPFWSVLQTKNRSSSAFMSKFYCTSVHPAIYRWYLIFYNGPPSDIAVPEGPPHLRSTPRIIARSQNRSARTPKPKFVVVPETRSSFQSADPTTDRPLIKMSNCRLTSNAP